jgi:hypothetical protein
MLDQGLQPTAIPYARASPLALIRPPASLSVSPRLRLLVSCVARFIHYSRGTLWAAPLAGAVYIGVRGSFMMARSLAESFPALGFVLRPLLAALGQAPPVVAGAAGGSDS